MIQKCVLHKLTLFVFVAFSFAACASSTVAGRTTPKIQFQPLDFPANPQQVVAASSVLVNGVAQPFGFRELVRTGQKFGDEVFGLIKDIKGKPLLDDNGTPFICRTTDFGAGPDFTSLLQVQGQLHAVTQFECAPGAIYISSLEQSVETGSLRPRDIRSLDMAGVRGGAKLCAGVVTPWGSHLGGEEYNTDAAILEGWRTGPSFSKAEFDHLARYVGATGEINPYDYGWMTQVAITDKTGRARVTKEYAMGRFSHELAFAMPDQRTFYMTDDGTNAGFYMFVAKRSADLSAGKLYAARWNQKSDAGGGRAALTWVDLGYSESDAIEAFINKRPRISSMLDIVAPTAENVCPAGFQSTNTWGEPECLRLREGVANFASRLETRRYAGFKEATTEFRKAEGLAYSPSRNVLYMAMSEISLGMLDGVSQDAGGPNHIRLAQNICGGVYELELEDKGTDTNSIAIESKYIATSINALLMGSEENSELDGRFDRNCASNAIANPDNLVYVPEADTLLIAEDSNRVQANSLWAYEFGSNKMFRILTAPRHAEVTSLGWYAGINGWGYVTVVIQHPLARSKQEFMSISPDQQKASESIVGYLGPVRRK